MLFVSFEIYWRIQPSPTNTVLFPVRDFQLRHLSPFSFLHHLSGCCTSACPQPERFVCAHLGSCVTEKPRNSHLLSIHPGWILGGGPILPLRKEPPWFWRGVSFRSSKAGCEPWQVTQPPRAPFTQQEADLSSPPQPQAPALGYLGTSPGRKPGLLGGAGGAREKERVQCDKGTSSISLPEPLSLN